MRVKADDKRQALWIVVSWCAGQSFRRLALALLLTAVVSAELLSAIVWHLLYGPAGVPAVLKVGGIVSVAVALPMVLFVVLIIKKLEQSLTHLERTKEALDEHVERLEKGRIELKAARDEARQASEVKSNFLAHMSHELRTPLNAIIGFSQLIQQQMLGPVPRRYVEYGADIHEAGQHLLEIVNDLLDLTKIEAGKLELRKESSDVERLVRDTVRSLRHRVELAGLELGVSVAAGLPPAEIDRRAVKQVLLNLVSNAIKFTPAPGRIDIAARSREDSIEVAVADTGIGIREADIERVLQPFSQVENILSRSQGGTGLGLPLTKRLVEMHGGAIRIASHPGAGTTVTVSLPVRDAVSRALPARRAAAS